MSGSLTLHNLRAGLAQLPNRQMAQDLEEILGFMEGRPDPHLWLAEYSIAQAKLSYWIGQTQGTVRSAENELNRIKGELDTSIRQEIVESGDKLTEDKVRRRIYANSVYRAQDQVVAACKAILTFLRGLRTAWNPDLLVQLSVNWRHQSESQ